MAMYWVCEYCGANLDFGERCDCQNREAKAEDCGKEASFDGAKKCKSE